MGLFRRLGAWLSRTPARAPEPDVGQQPTFHGEELVEVKYSKRRRNRAAITHDRQARYRVHLQSWDTSGWKVGGSPTWIPSDRFACFADTLDRARDIAREALLNTPEGLWE